MGNTEGFCLTDLFFFGDCHELVVVLCRSSQKSLDIALTKYFVSLQSDEYFTNFSCQTMNLIETLRT